MTVTARAIEKLDDLAGWEIIQIETLAHDADPHDIDRLRHLGEIAFPYLGMGDDAAIEEMVDFRRLGKAVNAKATMLRDGLS
jgi:hypothetical protein